MKTLKIRLLAMTMALVTMITMTGLTSIPVEAAKSNVTVSYSEKKVKKPVVTSVKAGIDGNKASKKATIYLSGKKKVKVDMQVEVKVKGKSNKKLKNANKVTYKSSNTKVATVSSKGVITAKKAGKTTITVTSKANKKKTYKIKVTVKQGVKSMKLKCETSLTMKNGEEKTFTPIVTVDKKSKVKKTITVASSDKKVATVSVTSKGVVTIKAVGAGMAEIKVAPKYGSDKAKIIKVKVEPNYRYTRVDFVNPDATDVTVKGNLNINAQANNTLSQDVKELLEAIGGTYTLTIGTRTIQVTDGVAEESLENLLTNKSQADVKITGTKKISEFITMIENMKTMSKDVSFGAAISLSDGNATITNIMVKKDGSMLFTLLGKEYTAFVKKGNVYLVGNHAELGNLALALSNSSIIKGFTPVEE